MAASAYQYKIITTGTGASDHIFLPEKENGQLWNLFLFSGTWGDTDLQNSGDGTNWGDYKGGGAAVLNFTANGSCVVQGNQYIRLDVNTHSAAITLLAK